MLMNPNNNERAEWARMSRALPLGHARNVYATAAASISNMRLVDFDWLQAAYRDWLVFGVIPEFDSGIK